MARFSMAATCIIVALFAAIIGIQDAQAAPDLRGFDPAKMGRLESSMWRSYYEGRYVRLGWQTMKATCGQYRFSWWDGARISLHAARAARYFRANADDPRCVPALVKYYTIIQRSLGREFDVQEAARLELQWWRERRLNLSAADYGKTIARLTALTYGVPEDSVLPTAVMRAEAMAYRDARRGGKMTGSDWDEVTRQLTLAYVSLKTSVADGL